MIRLIRRVIDWLKEKLCKKKMRRKISLYIDNRMVDLDDDSFILFNYTQEDLTDPAIVRNSFSQQITLKGTARNNAIFGDIYRLDRKTQYGAALTGVDFDPTRKTPFVIYNEMSEILESGYIKLDKVSRRFSRYEYTITLFGGLGSFFYGLSYDEDGNKRTLADLDFFGTLSPEDEFDFTIDKDAVLNAWARLGGDTTKDALWDTLNFSPAYNGLPTGTFNADKAICYASNAGLKTSDGAYSTKGGYVLCNLAKEYTEWEVKDLRSYLQKPVIKMSAIIDAICNPDNNGGYSVTLDSDFFNSSNPYYEDAWLTLPTLNSFNTINNGEGEITLLWDLSFTIPNGGVATTKYDIDMCVRPQQTGVQESYTDLYMHTEETYSSGGQTKVEGYVTYIEFHLYAYDANDNLLGEVVKYASSIDGGVPVDLPDIDFIGHFDGQGKWKGDDLNIHFDAYGIDHIRLLGANRILTYGTPRHMFGYGALFPSTTSASNSVALGVGIDRYDEGENPSTYRYKEQNYARTGAEISKKLLLSSDKTPADYLLSYCKMFGLQFLCDKGEKKISILMRKNLYDGDTIDLTERINLEKGIEKVPFAFDSKWYDFGLQYKNGEFAKYYQNTYSKDFGLQRVNTGYEFNADSKAVMDSVLFSGNVEVLEKGKYYIDIMQGGKYIPSVFLDGNATYNLYNSAGDAQEYPIPIPNNSAVATYVNPDYAFYDIFPKLQFHDEENKAFEEKDTLVFFRGFNSLISERYAITDDNDLMLSMNDNTPCWWLDYQLIDPSCKVTSMPMFSRYVWSGESVVSSMDFGTPSEVQIPDVTFASGSSIYEQFWKKYIEDRYDDDSSVITCYVNLSGLQVNESLFRNFYYFEGAIWALNKIVNHSMTTFDPTQCEFVKVQDINNYITY